MSTTPKYIEQDHPICRIHCLNGTGHPAPVIFHPFLHQVWDLLLRSYSFTPHPHRGRHICPHNTSISNRPCCHFSHSSTHQNIDHSCYHYCHTSSHRHVDHLCCHSSHLLPHLDIDLSCCHFSHPSPLQTSIIRAVTLATHYHTRTSLIRAAP